MVQAKKTGSGCGSGCKISSLNQAFGQRLKSKRDGKGITQTELASILGCGESTILRYERGELPKGDYLLALSEVLECSIDWLLKGESGAGSPKRPDTIEPKESLSDSLLIQQSLGFGECAEMLAKIFASKNQVLIRAISANLLAFSETVDAKITIAQMKEDQKTSNDRVAELERRMDEQAKKIGELQKQLADRGGGLLDAANHR